MHSQPPSPPQRWSLRHATAWLVSVALLLLVSGGVVVTLVTSSALRLAEYGGANTATQRMEALRAVGNLERLIALGDQFQSENDPARWRHIGLTMQALTMHPSIRAEVSSGMPSPHAIVSEMMRLRQREQAVAPGSQEIPDWQTRRSTLWIETRQALKEVADLLAAGMVADINRAAEDISQGARLVLAITLISALLAGGLGLSLFWFVRRHLVAPLVSVSDYLTGLRKGLAPAEKNLPRASIQEIGELVDAAIQLAEAQRALEKAAVYDQLTGLSNRYGIEVRLEQAINHARRYGKKLAVVIIDLDRFKAVNDSLSHASGDQLLCTIAQRFTQCLRETDLAGRIGGDEFVIVLNDLERAADAVPVIRKLMEVVERPTHLDELELRMSASIGLCVFPENGEDVGTLMKHADTAMYHAKASGRATFQFFDAEMNAVVSSRLRMETEMRHALDAHEFVLYFQPQVSGSSSVMLGVEALIRWQREDGRMVSPAEFIPLAEENNFILPLGSWVLREACKHAHHWQALGLPPVRMAVNLSARQLRDENLVARVAELLQEFNLPASVLEIEITESVAMEDPERSIHTLKALKALGVGLAIDDFGTGYSSLAYLKLLPIDRLKLDHSFVRDIESDPDDASICAATVSLAHSMNLEVVAEGVETLAQADFLRKLGCDILQGYYFHRPMPATAIINLLRQPSAR